MNWMAALLLTLGGLICCGNFYLSFPRYLLHRARGGARDNYQWVSGIPVVGSLFVAISLLEFWQQPVLCIAATILIVIDTGGLHWFVGTMLYHHFVNRRARSGSAHSSELLITTLILFILAGIFIPLARQYGLSWPTTIILVLGGYGALILLLQHRNLIDWLRSRRQNKK